MPIHSRGGAVSCSGPDVLLSDAVMSFLVSQDWRQRSILDVWAVISLPYRGWVEGPAALDPAVVRGPPGEGQLRAEADEPAAALGPGGTGRGPAGRLTLKHKVKVSIWVSRKTVTRDPIRKNRIKPWN